MSIIFASISYCKENQNIQESRESLGNDNSISGVQVDAGAAHKQSETRTLLEYSAAQGNSLSQISKMIQGIFVLMLWLCWLWLCWLC